MDLVNPLEKLARRYITLKCCRGHSYVAAELAIQRIAAGKYPLDLMCTHTLVPHPDAALAARPTQVTAMNKE